ncbi:MULTISPECIES: P-type DNA transfer ATPase VirB11 [Agrobacterium tumefaciens complex]|uniref:P-type DNA transfer ATPase VirB11 n=1 Tax=Agrobacterium tumefaciens complex TaxID=1183400 RepID=UPI00080FDAF3|nr:MULTISPECIES: P-type DNA transfer ATPase VirB11 [Agrobacterium tumefaciens complex]NSL21160.1 P-type DNA transfer ATPase VirB11 [Agrobacterium tumefaciens]NTC57483.1 P-type DNA transfer ATPase VirB11 [Agrobacterium tumefaciens]NTC59567.1 P-type DNA transfer ATPase VirB11 [Agrobacterium tumefaciens]NTC66653.1 P-type DNA transfer ATPase VirB11 [Agrobacterium tumefaciens]NTC70000.1 P-type DNA transfer ATPase VirB11 [Agrobacterium tumefaciens]
MEVDPQLRFLLKPILEWLDDPKTEEIAINRPGEAFVRQAGIFTKMPLPVSYDDLEDIAILAGALRKQDVGPRNPLCATELPGGERLQICLPPTVPSGTVSLTIRRPSSRVSALKEVSSRYDASRWNQWQTRRKRQNQDDEAILQHFDNGDLEAFLHACVVSRLTMLLCGPTGSGKTTMSKTLISAIPPQERLITIEDTLELVIPHDNHVRLLYSKNGVGLGAVSAEHLLQASLRMRPDRILLGEMRDDAAWAYLSEVVSGHPGSISTIHGANPIQGFKKLFSLVKSSAQGASLEDRTLIDMLSTAIDVIIPFRAYEDVYEVGEIWLAADARRRGETIGDLLNQ